MEDTSRDMLRLIHRLGWLLLGVVGVVLVVVLVVAVVQSRREATQYAAWNAVSEAMREQTPDDMSRKLQAVDDRDTTAWVLGSYQLGWRRLAADQLSEARNVFDKAAEAAKGNPLLAGLCRYGLASTHIAEGQTSSARDELEALAADGPAFVRTWADQDLALLKNNQEQLELIAEGKDPAQQKPEPAPEETPELPDKPETPAPEDTSETPTP